MTLPVSGAISFNNINVELGVSGTTQASLGQTSYRTLAGVASGQISMSNFYGKANQFALTISSNTTNANLRSLAVAAGWNQSTKVVATINSGVIVSSNSTGTTGLVIDGSFPGGVELINNGFIIGMGGAGGRGNPTDSGTGMRGQPGASGGLAMSVSTAVTITNNNIIGGGGGGGGGGGWGTEAQGKVGIGGGGGGGGRTGATNSAGGVGGVAGYAYGNPGGAGTSSAPGAGGTGGYHPSGVYGASGGGGGTLGGSGSAGAAGTYQPANSGGSGGGGGACLTGNSNITWVTFGTRLGAIS